MSFSDQREEYEEMRRVEEDRRKDIGGAEDRVEERTDAQIIILDFERGAFSLKIRRVQLEVLETIEYQYLCTVLISVKMIN